MKNAKLYIALLLPALLTACSFGKNTVDVEAVKKIKTVAVIMYTVPEQIVYRGDPREKSASLLAALTETAIGKNGSDAANAAVRTFTETLQKQGLPFDVMSHSKVISNAKFAALYNPVSAVEKKADSGVMSFLGSLSGSKITVATAPAKMNQYGLVRDWRGDTALTKKAGEADYIKKAIEALKVDAVMVVNDMGFTFSCEACVGVSSAMSGVASTGSAFNATLMTRTGSVMNIREWFGTTDKQGAMLAGIVNPLEHKGLFEEHGRRMAEVYAEAAKESLIVK